MDFEIPPDFQEKLKGLLESSLNSLDEKEDSNLIILGKIVHYHQLLENIVNNYLVRISGNKKILDHIHTHGKRFEYLLSFKDLDRYQYLLIPMRKLSEIRNDLVHKLNPSKAESLMKEIDALMKTKDKEILNKNWYTRYRVYTANILLLLGLQIVTDEYIKDKESEFKLIEKNFLQSIIDNT